MLGLLKKTAMVLILPCHSCHKHTLQLQAHRERDILSSSFVREQKSILLALENASKEQSLTQNLNFLTQAPRR